MFVPRLIEDGDDDEPSEFPSTIDFVHAFFNSRNGIYRYLSVLLVPQEEGGYELQPSEFETTDSADLRSRADGLCHPQFCFG